MKHIIKYKGIYSIIIFLVALLIINIFIFIPAFSHRDESWTGLEQLLKNINANNASQYGSFLSGYVGSFFSLISIILLFITLTTQLEKSEQDKFDSRFYTLLELHRKNVDEMRLQSNQGRRVFVKLFQEYQVICDVLDELCIQKNDQANFNALAYTILYYGVGDTSDNLLKDALQIGKKNNSLLGENQFNNLLNKLNCIRCNRKFVLKFCTFKNKSYASKFDYTLFDGHMSRLGHYYCHLFQLVNFVDNSKINLTHDEKKEYMKTIRAQLSIYEQALLAISIQSSLGKEWLSKDSKDKSFIARNNLIKNIPEKLIKNLDLQKIYKDVTFDFQETKENEST